MIFHNWWFTGGYIVCFIIWCLMVAMVYIHKPPHNGYYKDDPDPSDYVAVAMLGGILAPLCVAVAVFVMVIKHGVIKPIKNQRDKVQEQIRAGTRKESALWK